MSTNDDSDLRALLHETAAGITPQGSLEDIKERTTMDTKRRWIVPTLAAAAAMALVVGGIGWMLNDDNPQGSPGPAQTPTGDATGAPTVSRAVPVYLVGDAAQGTRLFREFENQDVCTASDCLVQAAVISSIVEASTDPDYRSLWPSGSGLHDIELSDDLITVDLAGNVHDRPSGMSQDDADLAIQQVIYSAQAAYGKGRLPVQLLLNGSHSDTILGVPTSEPLAAADELDVLAPVQISSPANGATVKAGPVKIEGLAATFEANVVWEVLVGGDAVVKNGFDTAAECCKLAPYSFTVDLEPGSYTIVVHDEDMSGEGRPVNTDTKEIVVE